MFIHGNMQARILNSMMTATCISSCCGLRLTKTARYYPDQLRLCSTACRCAYSMMLACLDAEVAFTTIKEHMRAQNHTNEIRVYIHNTV